MSLYPTAFMELGIRDGYPPGTRYWTDRGLLVGQLRELLEAQDVRDPGRLCVTERPDVMTKLLREKGCDSGHGGGGCDWEGNMDGAFGEQEHVVKHAGVVAGGDEASLKAAGVRWEAAAWKHRLVVLRPRGPAQEQRRVVASGPDFLRVDESWTVPPRVGDRFEIRGSFDPQWVKQVSRDLHEAAVRDNWERRRDVCGRPGAPQPCRSAAEPLDPFHPSSRRSWPDWVDRDAITSLATSKSVPALYGPVLDASSGTDVRGRWTDPFFRVSAVVMNLSDPVYREWRIRYLMYKLRDHGLSPGAPTCIRLAYKPGWYVHYDEASRGPSGDVCAVPASGLWTGPAHVCRDGSAPGGPLMGGLYAPGEFETAINSYIRELLVRLSESGWNQVRLITVERPTFAGAKWSVLAEDVRRHPAVIGEWQRPIEPPLSAVRNRPVPGAKPSDTATPPAAPASPPDRSEAAADAGERLQPRSASPTKPRRAVENSRGGGQIPRAKSRDALGTGKAPRTNR